jgi:hypothetical protein
MDNFKKAPALLTAITANDVPTATALLAAGADPFIQLWQGTYSFTALHVAAKTGCDDIVEAMIVAARLKSVGALKHLLAAKDSVGHSVHEVALSDRARCLIDTATGESSFPCPAQATEWHITIPSWRVPKKAAGKAVGKAVSEAANACNGSIDPAQCSAKYKAMCADAELGDIIQTLCPVMCKTCTETDEARHCISPADPGGSCHAGEAGAGCGSGAAVAAAGIDGWQRYTDAVPPLMLDVAADVTDASDPPCDITQVHGEIDSDTFLQHYRTLQRPIIFRGAAAHWAAASKWTKEYLIAKAGSTQVQCGVIPYGELDGVPIERMPLKTFLDTVMAGHGSASSSGTRVDGPAAGPGTPLYVFDHELLEKVRTELEKRPGVAGHVCGAQTANGASVQPGPRKIGCSYALPRRGLQRRLCGPVNHT